MQLNKHLLDLLVDYSNYKIVVYSVEMHIKKEDSNIVVQIFKIL